MPPTHRIIAVARDSCLPPTETDKYDNLPSTPMIPLRLRSPLIKEIFPSFTSILSKETLAENFPQDHPLQPFLRSFEQYEIDKASAYDPESMRLRAILLINSKPDAQTTTNELPDDVEPRFAVLLCSYLVGCRLVDLSFLAKISILHDLEVRRHDKMELTAAMQKSKSWEHLHDWRLLLKNFRQLFESVPESHVQYPPESTQQDPSNHHLFLLRSIVRRDARQKLSKILANIEVASLHLNFMLKGKLDLPDKGSWSSTPLGKEELDFLEQFSTTPHRLRLPLQVALLWSLLSLFNPIQWFKKDQDRLMLLKTSISIGNAKPALLVKIESLGLEMLFSVAQGMPTNKAVCIFIDRIPWPELDKLNDEEIQWFSPSRFRGYVKPSPSAVIMPVQDANDPSAFPAMSSSIANSAAVLHHAQSPRREENMDIDEGHQTESAPQTVDVVLMDVDVVPAAQTPRTSPRLKLLATQASYPRSSTSPAKRKRPGKSSVPPTLSVDIDMDAPAEAPQIPIHTSSTDTPEDTSEPWATDIAGKAPVAGASWDYPIDVDQIMDEMEGRSPITLDHSSCPKKYTSKEHFQLYSARAASEKVQPAFHDPKLINRFKAFFDGVQASFVDEVPLHMSGGRVSVFKVIQRAAYISTSHKVVQDILRSQHIVIPDMDVNELQFDENGLETFASLDDVLDVKDHSLSTDSNCTNIVRGTLEQILHCSQVPNSKILSASPHLMGLWSISSHPFSSEVHAWRQTSGLPFCKATTSFPADRMHWTLIATCGAHSSWTIAPSGYGTCIDIRAGKVWCVVGRSRTTSPDLDTMASTTLFVNDTFGLDTPNLNLWDLEAMLLEPRTRLVLRPNTPYTFFIFDNSIISGTYFYATSTMRSTMFGLIHEFMGVPIIDATSHAHYHSPGLLMRRMVNFYHQYMVRNRGRHIGPNTSSHLFDLENPRTPFDILIFCAVVILLNVLDPQTYQNQMPLKDRVASMYARGEAIHMVDWLFTKYDMVDTETGNKVQYPLQEIFIPYLAQLHNALLSYHAATLDKQVHITRHLNSGAFRTELQNGCQAYASFLAVALFRQSENQRQYYTLVPEDEERYVFQRRRHSEPLVWTDHEILTTGTTSFDESFIAHLDLQDDIWFASATEQP